MQVEHAQLREILDNFFLDALEQVVAQIQPKQILFAPHDAVQNFRQSCDCSKPVLLQEEGISFAGDHKLLGFTGLLLCLRLFLCIGRDALRASSQGNVVLLQDLGDLLVWLGTNHDLLGFLVLLSL